LLTRFRPELRYDRQYDYRAAPAETAVHGAGNLLRRDDGEVIARVGGEPDLTLDTLAAYPSGREAEETDVLCQVPDHLGDARSMARDERFPEQVYGRVVEEDGRTWLQYWFWLYYNPKSLFGIGRHEGDWEMVQYALGDDGRPAEATYAQHAGGEPGRPELVEGEDGGVHPVVYVAPLSHASYFDPGTKPYLPGIDHPYGDGPRRRPPVADFGPWASWPGRWGQRERTPLVSQGPQSPACQAGKWDSPATFHRKAKRWRFRLLLGRLLHRIGGATYPLPPELSARRDGVRVVVGWKLRRSGLRRARHIYITVHDGDDVLASRTLKRPAPEDSASLGLAGLAPEGAELTVWASSFNFFRQRSNIAETRVFLQP
jgi:hypothetical protein